MRKHIGIQFKVSSSLVLASSYLAGVIRDSAYIVQLARTPRSSIYTSLCYRGYFLNLCIIYLNLMASATLRSAVSVIREVLSTRQYQYSQYLQRSPDTFMVLFQSRNVCVLTRNLKAQHETWPRDTNLVMFVLDESEIITVCNTVNAVGYHRTDRHQALSETTCAGVPVKAL